MASMNTRLNIEKLDENIVQKHGGSKQVGFKQLGPGAQGDREAEVFQVSNDDIVVAQRRLENKQPEEKTNTDCLVKQHEKEYQTGWKIKTGNVLDSCNQKSTQQCMKSEVAKHLGVVGIQQQNGLVDEINVTLFAKVRCFLIQSGLSKVFWAEDTTRSTYLVNMSPSSAIGFKKPIDKLGFFGWLASIKQGMLELVKVKCIFLRCRKGIVGTGLMQVLHGFEFEVAPLGDHTFEVEPQENVDQEVGLQEVQAQDLMDYQLVRDREQHLACELFGYREDGNEAAFAVATVEKIYAYESLTFNDTVACEVISKWKAGLKEGMDVRSDVYVLNNGCRKSSDDGHDYYWEYAPESGYELRLVAGIATGVLVKGCSLSEVPVQVKVVVYRSNSTIMLFIVNLYHDGVFIERPFDYTNGDLKVIDDVDFEEMLYVHMFDIIRRVVLISPTSLFFKLVDEPLVGLKPLKTDEDVGLFVKALYENGSIIDLYYEHNGYDVMEMIQNEKTPKEQAVKTLFKCNVDDDAPSNLEDLKDIVDFEVKGEENVVIFKNTTDDPWLNKLLGKGNFIGHTDDPITNLGGRFIHEENDPEDDIVDPKCKAMKNIVYPPIDPTTPWDQCNPVLDEGKCAAFKVKKPKDKNHDVDCSTNSDKADCSSKPDHAECSSKPETKKNGRTSEAIKERWTKACALYDHKEGLVEHYDKLWEYRQAILESYPGSTCQLETEDKDDDTIYFKRMYICFKAMGRDGNNQMYPLAWVVVGVENKDNWAWFLSLLQEDLKLGYGGGLTILSDGHKACLFFWLLYQYLVFFLPDSEHKQCTRHIYANFKRKWSGLQYKRLFWGAAACTVEQQFLQKMEQIKELDPTAHKWIIPARGKPIITMLEDIRIYLMQRMCHMNKLEDTITPSVKRQLEYLKERQRNWLVYPSGYREELSGILCVHAMAAYYHMNMDPELGVNEFYSKQQWYNAYQYSIRPVPGSNLWKPYENPSPLPPIERKRRGKPRKQRIKHPIEDDNHVSRVGKIPNNKGKGPLNSKDKGIDMSTTKRGNINVLGGSSKKRGTIRIRSPIKRGEDNQVTKGDSMGDCYLTTTEYQHKMDIKALAEDNKLNVHQVSMDLPVNEAPKNCTTKESHAQDLDPAPTLPTQEIQVHTRSKRKKQVATTCMRIYIKNRGRSERISNMQANKFKFDGNGIGSTANKAFNIFEDEE
ncbi:zinc finger, CCHC-type containing protein [Tanacetum coccineum]|uniref:Zinc finger, CCHC-type containing protein n=1 Tax=Tanacetum coccineum TaxID=301880 RepID=A0ABQ4ZK38_9ASTR